MVIIFSKFQVPSSYGLGMVEKGHVRGNRIDHRHNFSLAWGNTWHKGGESRQKNLGNYKSILYLAGKN